ncbi:DNA-3-methyladenine glycosylase [Acetivibrio saccincola]|uniref:DNA-3-methyladenine glycosylase n=1 Tax=Acetivibrio saccincola TaxID=1677857 RepID=UPI001863ACBD|nr:DNA-3-methyladenine glycosylase [Acetivibrio saccincola]HOA96168.1 DNA-3-methyladenine glycosylase [Acetivibrio saccincola]HQD28301.1 DNA-3-methyladenine glycosylase [Acetivibrio saccincola]
MKLKRDFYERDTLEVAKELLGKYIIRVSEEGTTVGKIVEVEAYIGPLDAAAHTYRGKRSSRTEVAFGPGGHGYVYLIYGMYHCFNIVTNVQGKPEMVLIRAVEPVEGIELMKKRRNTEVLKNLCSGPGKLCQAMDITKKLHGIDLCGDNLYLLDNEKVREEDIIFTPRINIDYAGEAKEYPWRFLIKDNKFISTLKHVKKPNQTKK